MRCMRGAHIDMTAEGRYTLAFLGYGPEEDNTVFELTYNWDRTEPYDKVGAGDGCGSGLGLNPGSGAKEDSMVVVELSHTQLGQFRLVRQGGWPRPQQPDFLPPPSVCVRVRVCLCVCVRAGVEGCVRELALDAGSRGKGGQGGQSGGS